MAGLLFQPFLIAFLFIPPSNIKTDHDGQNDLLLLQWVFAELKNWTN